MSTESTSEFSYTYSATEQEEVRSLREKYLPRERTEDKMQMLRRLDEGVTKKATLISLIIGILGALIMGGGMSLCMVWPETYMLWGLAVGIVGIAVVSVNYPIYTAIVKKERARVAPEILRLTEELLK